MDETEGAIDDDHPIKVVKGYDEVRIEYRYGGMSSLASNMGVIEIDPLILTTIWLVASILFTVMIVVLTLLSILPVFLGIFFIGVGALMAISGIAAWLNRTIFTIKGGYLAVKTRPISLRPTKSFRLSEITNVQSYHFSKTVRRNRKALINLSDGNMIEIPQTMISVYLTKGNPVPVMKMDEDNGYMDDLANIVMENIVKNRPRLPTMEE